MITDKCFENFAPLAFPEAKELVQNGDLILCSGDGLVSGLIKDATKSCFSHVGMILCMPVTGQWLVVESVESIGVRCVTLLDGYVNNYQDTQKGYPGKVLIARHSEMASNFKYIESLYARAFQLMGDKYSREDIFKIASRITLNKIGIHKSGDIADNNRYICSEYVYACFKAVKIDMPFDSRGFIAPSDIARLPEVKPVCQLAVSMAGEVRDAKASIIEAVI